MDPITNAYVVTADVVLQPRLVPTLRSLGRNMEYNATRSIHFNILCHTTDSTTIYATTTFKKPFMQL